jgi:predicted permease
MRPVMSQVLLLVGATLLLAMGYAYWRWQRRLLPDKRSDRIWAAARVGTIGYLAAIAMSAGVVLGEPTPGRYKLDWFGAAALLLSWPMIVLGIYRSMTSVVAHRRRLQERDELERIRREELTRWGDEDRRNRDD